MKIKSRLAVLLAAVLACVSVFAGMAFAAATELNSDLSDVEAAMSAEEVQAELAYQQLLACTTVQEMYAALFEGENPLFPILYYMNQEQLNGAYTHAQELYDALENPTLDDEDYRRDVCDSFLIVASEMDIELLGTGEIFDDYTISSDSDAINSLVTIENNDNGGEANWSFSNGTLTINKTVTIPKGQSLDILVSLNDSDKKGKIIAGADLGDNPMFIVQGQLKIAKTANNDNQNHGSIEINGGIIQVESGGTIYTEDITTVSGTATWKFADGANVNLLGDVPVSGSLSVVGSSESATNITRQYTDGAMFAVNNGATLSLDKVVIDGKSTVAEKAVIVTQGNDELPAKAVNVYVQNSTFKDCASKTEKGASAAITISNYSKFKLEIDGCTFDNCDSISGGAVYFVGSCNGTASITKSTFKNCHTEQGGAIRTNGNGGVVATVEQCVFLNNHATNKSGDSHGGAIYWNACGVRADNITAKMDIYDCQFIGNSSTTYAGAIFNESFMTIGTKVKDSDFTMDQTAPGKIRGTLIKGNSSAYGGGIEIPTYGGGADEHNGIGADLTLSKGVFIIENKATYGGGLAMRVGKGTVGDSDANKVKFEINIDGAVIQGNEATEMGGGIYLERENGEDNYPSWVNLKSGTITGNKAPKGGAVCVYNANKKKSTKTNEVKIGSESGTLSISDNVATGDNGLGGAIYISYGDVKMINGTVQGNTAKNGGAICVEQGEFAMSNGVLSKNNATEQGGAVYVTGGNFALSDGRMSENSAVNGGAAYVSGGDFTMTGGTIGGEYAGNTASDNGGAVYVTGGSFEMANGSITHNTATNNGGAIYMADGNFTMHHGTVSDNSATNGGAVYMAGANAVFTMEAGTMSNNSAVAQKDGDGNTIAGGDGGAIYATGGTLHIGLKGCPGSEVEVVNNRAEVKDEKKEAHQEKHTGCTVGDECTHPLIQGNTADDCGGAIAIAKQGNTAGVVYLYCGNAINNTAIHKGVGMNVFMDGGDFYFYDGANVGVPRDPDLVIVGGKLNNQTENKGYINLYYYATNDPGENTKTMVGMAKEDEVMNLPDAQYFFDAPVDMRFVGWTAKGKSNDSTADQHVRNKNQYAPSGTPVTVSDTEAIGESQKTWDGTAEGTMHLYALWAPIVNNITYVDGLCGLNTESFGEIGSGGTDNPNPDTYENQVSEKDYTISKVEKSGYTLLGWYIYQDLDQNANWGYEPVNKTSSTKEYDLNYAQFPSTQFLSVNPNGTTTLKVPSLTFGNITLVAKWQENVAAITYMAVGPTRGSGYVGLGNAEASDKTTVTEYIGQATGRRYSFADGKYTLTSKGDTDTPQGATAIANTPNFKFEGWYKDEDCTQKVSESDWVDGDKLTPQKVDLTATDTDTTALYQTATYYAKFVYNVADLTIIKEGLKTGDSAILTVTGYNADDNETTTWTIVLTDNKTSAVIKDLRIGSEYKITEKGNWSVYYTTQDTGLNVEKTVQAFNTDGTNPNSVTITNVPITDKWLHNESAVVNVFGKPSTTAD